MTQHLGYSAEVQRTSIGQGYKKRRGLAALFLSAMLGVASAAGGMTLHQAVAKVRHDTGGKILSAQTVPRGKHMVHKIRVLMKNGKVRVVSVRGKPRKPR